MSDDDKYSLDKCIRVREELHLNLDDLICIDFEADENDDVEKRTLSIHSCAFHGMDEFSLNERKAMFLALIAYPEFFGVEE